MDHKTVEEYVLSMPNAKLDYPFGEDVAVYKVFVPHAASASDADGVQGAAEEPQRTVHGGTESENRKPATQQSTASTGRVGGSADEQTSAVRGDWKMFALIPEGKVPVRISLKCDPQLAIVLRQKYETVQEGYHLNKKHWNTIVLSGQLTWEEVKDLIRHSYDLVAKNEQETPDFS